MTRGRSPLRGALVCVLVLFLLLPFVVMAIPAAADETEPAIVALAWYWKSKQAEEFNTPVGTVAAETPNPYCPALPSSLGAPPETCAEQRLPVEVAQGDYEEPDKISALSFDLTMVPPESTIQSFTVTFLEAESGCYEKEGSASATGQQCEETDPRNIDGKQLQACQVADIFGDGEARPYKEVPRYTCSDSDPIAEHKEIKNDEKQDPQDPDEDHIWTFDLTTVAQQWVDSFATSTSIMLTPVEPKDTSTPDAQNWRVILAGPKFPGGVKAELSFEPGEGGLGTGTAPPPSFAGGGGGTTPTTTTGGGSFGSAPSGGSVGGGTTPDVPGGDAPAPEEPADEGAPTAAEAPEVEAMPAYVWLALLAGLASWALVRTLILEGASGPRPNGVLAQIHTLNAARRGGDATEAAAGGGGLASVFGPVWRGIGSLVGKVKSIGRG